MSEKRILQLISRKLAGEATVNELEELEGYMRANPEIKHLYSLVNTPAPIEEGSLSKAEQAYALHQLKRHIYQPTANDTDKVELNKKTILKLNKYILVAAALLLVIIGAILFRSIKIPATKMEVVALKGSKTNVKLPDGTLVWLNSDSKINYENDFSNKKREVWLSGEAFFDVKHDSTRPFIIHTTKINIKVLGTAFNVKSYPNDSYTETSLIRGKIDVNFTDRPDEHIILRPNEKLIVSKNQQTVQNSGDHKPEKIKISLVSIEPTAKEEPLAETAWMNSKLVFNDTPFSEIANVLERRFDIKIIFTSNTSKDYRFTGTFEDEDLEEILQLMKITKPFNYGLNKKQLTIN